MSGGADVRQDVTTMFSFRGEQTSHHQLQNKKTSEVVLVDDDDAIPLSLSFLAAPFALPSLFLWSKQIPLL